MEAQLLPKHLRLLSMGNQLHHQASNQLLHHQQVVEKRRQLHVCEHQNNHHLLHHPCLPSKAQQVVQKEVKHTTRTIQPFQEAN